MTSNPFIIKIQPGTTEIDLAPVLEPIIYKIITQFEFSSRDRNVMYPSPDQARGFAHKAKLYFEESRLIEMITRGDLVRALTEEGWKQAYDDTDTRWSQWDHRWITLPRKDGEDDARLSIGITRTMVDTIFGSETTVEKIDRLRELLAGRLPLDAIVSACENVGE